jgi:hypothetical protein
MGLDIYVGSLIRYYTGNWETIIQQYGRETGMEIQVHRPPPPTPSLVSRVLGFFSPKGQGAVTRDIERWRQALGRQLGVEVNWNEDPEAMYFTDKPAWDCYGALVLWAAYDESPDAKRAPTAEGWSDDPAYQAVCRNTNSRHRHLVADTEMWLPIDFQNPITTKSVPGKAITIGSSIRLLNELDELNRRTWAAGEDPISQWRADGAEYGAPLETSARFAFSVFHQLTRQAVQRRLPMMLDY